MKTVWFQICGMILGAMIYSSAQALFLPCFDDCREAFIRQAMKDTEWSKDLWEEIGKRIESRKAIKNGTHV